MKRAVPSAVLVLAVATLAGVVAMVSHTSVVAPVRRGVADVGELLAVVALTFTLTFALAGVALQWLRRSRDVTWQRVLPTTVVVAVMASLWGIASTELHLQAPTPAVERTEPDSGRVGIRLIMEWGGAAVRRDAEEPEPEAVQAVDPRRAHFIRWLLGVVGAVGLASWLIVRRSRLRARPRAGFDHVAYSRDRHAAHGAIMATIDAMLADPDPRTAIIGAYARLLEGLEALGASRKAYEGPTEHLHRVLTLLEVPSGPLRTLVRLFQVARFSEHTLTQRHRDEALTALREAASSLAAPELAARDGPHSRASFAT